MQTLIRDGTEITCIFKIHNDVLVDKEYVRRLKSPAEIISEYEIIFHLTISIYLAYILSVYLFKLRNAKDTKYGTAIWPVSNVLETISGT
jgi:hypothetical protein